MDFSQYPAVFQKAYRVAYHYIGEHYAAEDVAQDTSIKLWMHVGLGRVHAVDAWLYVTARNGAFTFLKRQKRVTLLEDMDFVVAPRIYEEGPDLLTRLDEIPPEVISAKERAFVATVIARKGDLSLAAQVLNTRKSVVRNRLYRVRQEIALYRSIQNGVVHTPHPSGTRIHANISNFLKKLQHCLTHDCLAEMSGYFQDAAIEGPVPDLQMGRLHNYTLDELQSRHYMINVNYFTPEKEFRAYRVEVSFGKFGALRVLRFPILPKMIVQVAQADMDAETRELLAEDRFGVPGCSEADVEKILREVAGAKKIFEADDM